MARDMAEATELEYLQWFVATCDFGPAHEDVMQGMQEQFETEMGLRVPDNWRYDYDEDDE